MYSIELKIYYMRSIERCQAFLNAVLYNCNMKVFAERLKELRTAKKLSQRKLASQTKISPSAIKQWENESRVPNAEAVVTLAKFFDVSADYLLGLED